VALVAFIVQLFVLAMFVWIVLSFIVAFGRLPYDHPIRQVFDGLSRVFDPILRPIRAVVPPVRVGGAALDLSPLILLIGLQVLLAILT
jgi:YggT family protein